MSTSPLFTFVPPDVHEFLTKEDNLRYWLLFAASLRLLAVVLGYFFSYQLMGKVFAGLPKVPASAAGQQDNTSDKAAMYAAFTGPLCRTFAIWTAVTCLVTTFCAYHTSDNSVLALTVATFLLADLYFLVELAAGSVTIATITSPAIIAST
jgi:hypothetical protein